MKLLPSLMEHLKIERPFHFNTNISLIPKCPICGEGPGAHWPEYCPTKHEEHAQWIKDQLAAREAAEAQR